jgi:hypothetical protein
MAVRAGGAGSSIKAHDALPVMPLKLSAKSQKK